MVTESKLLPPTTHRHALSTHSGAQQGEGRLDHREGGWTRAARERGRGINRALHRSGRQSEKESNHRRRCFSPERRLKPDFTELFEDQSGARPVGDFKPTACFPEKEPGWHTLTDSEEELSSFNSCTGSNMHILQPYCINRLVRRT